MQKKKTDIFLENSEKQGLELEKFRFLLEKLTDEYIQKFESVQKQKKTDIIPLNIFSKNLSPLETVVKFLRENQDYSLKHISVLLRRSNKTIWQAYKSSKSKYGVKFSEDYSTYNIPVIQFSNRTFSILESLVSYLKTHYKLNYNQIANIISRDQRTVWTVHNRAINKT